MFNKIFGIAILAISLFLSLSTVFASTSFTEKVNDSSEIQCQLTRENTSATLKISFPEISHFLHDGLEGIFDSLYELGIGYDYNDSYDYTETYHQVGKLLMHGIAKWEKWNGKWNSYKTMWHCIGDPATYMRTEQPKNKTKEYWISQCIGDYTGWEIIIPDDYVKIIFYNPKKNEHKIYVSETSLYFETTQKEMDDWIVFVQHGDDVPAISYGDNIHLNYPNYVFP